MRYHSLDRLKPAGAKSCVRGRGRLTCRLDPSHRWSDGSPILARDYVAAARRLVDPAIASPHAQILFTLKNAKGIFQGKTPAAKLGVRDPDPRTVEFEFEDDDPEFEYKLIHPALSPLPPEGFPTFEGASTARFSGPYRVSEWKQGVLVKFSPNPYFKSTTSEPRPAAEAYFVDEDSTALRMYESRKLDFLRRLVATEVARHLTDPELRRIPQARFDYIGFGPALDDKPDLRAALSEGIDYGATKALFLSQTQMGCPSLPASYLDRPVCHRYRLGPSQAIAKAYGGSGALEFQFSRMGGDDIARAVEWFQGQWRRLGLQVRLESREQSVYVAGLKVSPPALFRKGVGLDRPTCLAAAEIFVSGHPDNLIRLHDPTYDRLVAALARAQNETSRRRACRLAIQRLLDTHRIIPLGEMNFSVLARPQFRGWDLNELNQLDLGNLTWSKDSAESADPAR